jgi:hypothetical protein
MFIMVAMVRKVIAVCQEPVNKYGIIKLFTVIKALQVTDLLIVRGCPSLKNLLSAGLRFHCTQFHVRSCAQNRQAFITAAMPAICAPIIQAPDTINPLTKWLKVKHIRTDAVLAIERGCFSLKV